MVQPAWIIPAGFTEVLGVTDVQTIMDQMTTIPVTIDGWTEPVGDTFRSAVDAAGRFYDLAFVRFSATQLHITMTDDQGRSTTQKMLEITGAGQTITFFHSPKYLYLVIFGTNNYMQSTLLTLDPESETAHTSYTIFNCQLTTAGSGTASTTRRWEQIDASNVYSDEVNTTYTPETRNGGAGELMLHSSGALKAWPIINTGDDGGPQNIRGRIYNAIHLNGASAVAGAEITVPINDGESAVFKALTLDIVDSCQYLVRKS